MSRATTRRRWTAGGWAAVGMLAVGWAAAVDAAEAVVGEAAPAFELPDTSGGARSLSEFEGRFVVLEWLNHDCPFVRKHYDSGNMQQLQSTYTAEDIAWLSIISSAPGEQGHVSPEEADALTRQRQAAPSAVLLDPEGVVGRRYGAKTTPHMFIIEPSGVLIYAGAIDDVRSTDVADVAIATNYVAQALGEARAGRPVSVAQTAPYGCSVKY